MWPRALFKLGWVELRSGKYQGAYDRFDELVRRGGDERQEGITGRAQYWRARALYLLGRRIDAAKAYEEIVQRWPLRYYAQQALWRLGEIDPGRAKAVIHDMRSSDEPTRMVFAWRDEFDAPGFDRMVELLLVNEVSYASSEMSALQMLGDDVDPEMAVVGAVLLQHAGAQTKLSRVIRAHFEDFEGLLPKGEGKLIWEATYPQAFSPLIENIAEDEGIPPSFVRAIAREESSFDPEAVSWAKAYGLVQLIMPTAKRFATEVGVKATPRTLKKPEVNLKIGDTLHGLALEPIERESSASTVCIQRRRRCGSTLARRRRNAPARRIHRRDSVRRNAAVHAPCLADLRRVSVARCRTAPGAARQAARHQRAATLQRASPRSGSALEAMTFGKKLPNSIALLMSPSTRSFPCTNAI